MIATLATLALVVTIGCIAAASIGYACGRLAGIEYANRIWGVTFEPPVEVTRRQCRVCLKDCSACVCAKVQKVRDDIEITLSSAKKGGRA